MPNRRTFLILTAASLLPVSARLVRPARNRSRAAMTSLREPLVDGLVLRDHSLDAETGHRPLSYEAPVQREHT